MLGAPIVDADSSGPVDSASWQEAPVNAQETAVEEAPAYDLSPRRSLRDVVVALAQSRRNLAIAAAAVGLLVIVLVFAMGGDDAKPVANKPVAAKPAPKVEAAPTPPPVEEPVVADPAVAPTPSEPTEATAPVEATPAEGSAPADPTETKPTETKPTETKPAVKKTATIGGKQVVLDYDTQAREAKPVANAPKDDQAAIAKARGAYAAGNQQLFANNTAAAIKSYRQALAYYPAYVAGYRGLGLAYAQQNDNLKAVQNLRIYVSSVPGAKDAAMIRNRIKALQKTIR